ncbi:MAG TPA: lysine 5,6-aminomutase subunit alpha [Thermoanaerobaculia bacterium]|nr:lysine 5,6-aminomutase subunit alpha [Thermoanaerobaculia bacterium]
MAPKLGLSPEQVARCRALARQVSDGVRRETERFTTVATERTVLRLLGVDGVDADEVPVPNRVVASLQAAGKLARGAAVWMGSALARGARGVGEAAGLLSDPSRAAALVEHPRWREAVTPLVETTLTRIRANRAERERRLAAHPPDPLPLLYAIVATGNIHEDVVQAEAAARAGAQCIAVIRSTAQSLLDHVPWGATTAGFGGTFATQENFRLMRASLDALEPQIGRYVRLVNYCSGLCMPEIAAMGALERLDMMLNDALYGIIFRDINPMRTLIDQNFSRRINAVAGVVINTGEDNYLTTADAVEQAPAVLASQFINERLARDAGLENWQIGLGHAFEIDPELEDGLLYEIAQAEAAREIFPDAPLKYMPPTKHMTGNVFRGYQQNALFVLTSVATGQSIHLLGMLTEALHTPFLHDRWLAITQADTIRRNARHLAEEIAFRPDGRIVRRAHEVLSGAEGILARVAEGGLFAALADGVFADTRRPRDRGRGFEGVVARDPDYANPFLEAWSAAPAGATA